MALGDEVTERWAGVLQRPPYVNRGIAGQTTAQMLVRFRQGRIAPAGWSYSRRDQRSASVFGPGTEGTMGDNPTSMTELAHANGIRALPVTPAR